MSSAQADFTKQSTRPLPQLSPPSEPCSVGFAILLSNHGGFVLLDRWSSLPATASIQGTQTWTLGGIDFQQFALKYSREETRQGHEVERKPWG